MVVALVDERGTIPAVTDPAVRNTGATIAHQIQHVRDDLAPSMADGDNGGVINALVIAAHDLTDLGAHSG
ncbi:hypothetical protein AL755_03785 (plasmid) [Arthrobacter sp. ERGS1:01]|nr:hypothetical protein AL755_03785 [Arthrobacter sp. ERGS1:01]